MDQLLLLAYSLKPTIYGPKTYHKVSRNGQNCHYNAVYMDLATSMTVWVVQRTQMPLIRSRVIKKSFGSNFIVGVWLKMIKIVLNEGLSIA